jgi:FixJ family two-component response regulator
MNKQSATTSIGRRRYNEADPYESGVQRPTAGPIVFRRQRAGRFSVIRVASRGVAGRERPPAPVVGFSARGHSVNDLRPDDTPIVVIVDDDENVRGSLNGLLRSVGLSVAAFSSVQDFLSSKLPKRYGCMILDIRLPGRSGLDFYDEIVKANWRLPVIFISGHADISMSVRAMKAGAAEFLTKPVRDQELLDAVHRAIELDRIRRAEERALDSLRAAFETLSPRERDVMALVATGRRNKQIAADVGISEATVKAHRGQVMQKMGAPSLADLIRMIDRLQLDRAK